jgi:type IV secretory pathway VirB6-like protein
MHAANMWFAFALGAFAEAAAKYVIAKWKVINERRNRVRAIFIALCCGSALVMGQGGGGGGAPAPTATPSTYAFSADSITAKISSKVDTKLNDLRSNSSLQGAGRLITAFFLVALLIWTTIKTMATSRGVGELIGEWVPIFISFGIVHLFLDRNAAASIESTMNGIAAAIAGSSMSNLESAIRAGAEPIFKGIAAVIGQPRAVEGANVTGGISGFVQTMVASAASWIMGAIAKVIAAFCLVIAGVIMTAHIIMGFISVSLVLALAPVMVPFLMFRPLSFLFDSWLKFLLSSCMLKVVVAFLLTVVSELLKGMSELATQFYRDSWQVTAIESLQVDILMLGMMMVFALLATFMLMQAPTIANGLLSGSGAMGFSGLKGLTSGSSSRLTSHFGSRGGAAAKNMAGGAASAAWNAQNSGRAWARGAYDAASGRSGAKWKDPAHQAIYDRRFKAGGGSP